MKTSTKLILILTLVVGFVMTIGGYFILRQREDVLARATRNEVRAHALTLRIALERLYRMDQHKGAQELIDRMRDNRRVYAVVLFSRDGEVAMVSNPMAVDEIRFPDEVHQVMATGETMELIRTIDNHEVFSILMPLDVGNTREGVMEIALSLGLIEEDYIATRREITLITLLLFLTIIIVVILVTRYSLSRPIEELLRGARALGHGDLSYRVIISAKDNEFAQLEQEFNRMADYLSEQSTLVQHEMERRLKLERELRHNEHLASVGRLAAGVAHEIGTPLSVIKVRAEQNQQDIEDSMERRQRNLSIIVTQVERITNIVRQLLNLARPYKIHRAVVDLGDLIGGTLEMLETQRQSAGVTAEFQPALAFRVLGDRELLRQVFINILVNAIHAMPQGGILRIAIGPETATKDGSRFVAVHISDTGIGIEETNLPFIFDPFFTTKDVGSGVGLGLPVSLRIIEEHNGWMEVANNPDKGVTFTVFLQVADAPTADAPAARKAPVEKERIAQ